MKVGDRVQMTGNALAYWVHHNTEQMGVVSRIDDDLRWPVEVQWDMDPHGETSPYDYNELVVVTDE